MRVAVVIAAGIDVATGGRPTHPLARAALTSPAATRIFAPVARPPAGVAPGAVGRPDRGDRPDRLDRTRRRGRRRLPDRARGAVVHASVTVSPDVEVGADCGSTRASWCARVRSSAIGSMLQPGVVIGGDGFGYVTDERGRPVTDAASRPRRDRGRRRDRREHHRRPRAPSTRRASGAARRSTTSCRSRTTATIGEDALIVAQSGLAGSTSRRAARRS